MTELLAPAAAPPHLRWRRCLAPAGALAAAAGVVVLVGLDDPNQAGHYPTCPFLALTGLSCPGCGTLRMLHALARGDLHTMLARNPLAVGCLPVLAFLWVAWARRSVTGRPRSWAAPGWLLWAFLAVVLLFWVLRNLPGFGWLAP